MKQSITKLLIACGLFYGTDRLYAQTTNDTIAADFDTFVELLTHTHPDPYTAFGGRISFYQKVRDTRRNLLQTNTDKQAFKDTLSAFLNTLQDGHTYIYNEKTSQKVRRLPIAFRCIPGGLVCSALPEKVNRFLGARLFYIEDTPLSVLMKKAAWAGCENEYGQLHVLTQNLMWEDFLRKAFPQLKTDTLRIGVLSRDNTKEEIRLPLLSAKAYRQVQLGILPSSDFFPRKQMDYRFLDKEKTTMMYRLSTVYDRAVFESMHRNGWDFQQPLSRYYARHMTRKIPRDTLSAIRAIPSLTRTFGNMLRKMKVNHSANLIIDLRGNEGGWTPIVLPTLYQLFGDRYLQTPMHTPFVRKVSPLYLQKIHQTLTEYQKEHKIEPGEYVWDDDTTVSQPIDSLRQQFINECTSDDKPSLLAQNGHPVYTPQHIYVVIDERTFSAAFHYAFFLWKMGATLVGIPSSQAPNAYMEVTPFKLPLTGIQGSISNSMQLFLPASDPNAHLLRPALQLTYEDYLHYNFSQQAELQYLWDYIRKNK